MRDINRENILHYTDNRRNLDGLIPHLRENYVRVIKDESIAGDAPKLFIRIYKYGKARKSNSKKWPAYIAKVGHKWYPNESITEQLFTELGHLYGLNIADSKLAIASGQLRFLSKFFLKPDEQLIHGAQIYASYLSDDDLSFVEEVENNDLSRDLFTLSFALKAIKHSFPNYFESFFCDFLEMLTFDAITGNNDRHFYNWGVIMNIKDNQAPYFSPIYDTARGLFWNYSDKKLKQVTVNKQTKNSHIKTYCEKSKPKIGIENKTNLNHFDLIHETIRRFPGYKNCIIKVINKACSVSEMKLIEDEFRYLISKRRGNLILECLNYRKEKLKTIINQV
ncbi:MAG TPA: HipA domain-containing protein [Balneolales bacterium]|nr:HipA domain-containing protein [Balneolales bacterium]